MTNALPKTNNVRGASLQNALIRSDFGTRAPAALLNVRLVSETGEPLNTQALCDVSAGGQASAACVTFPNPIRNVAPFPYREQSGALAQLDMLSGKPREARASPPPSTRA